MNAPINNDWLQAEDSAHDKAMKIERETHKLEKRLCRQMGQAISDFNLHALDALRSLGLTYTQPPLPVDVLGWGGAGGEGYRRDVHALQPVTPPHRGRPQSRFRHRIPGLSV
jgi:hypothetical protein